MCRGEGLDCDCSQAFGGGCKAHFQPAGGADGVGYMFDVQGFRQMGAADGSVVEIVRTGNDKTGFDPGAIIL